MKRMTLDQANAEKGYVDAARFDSLSDADIERMIDSDPDQAPPTETLRPLLDIGGIRRKLGFSQQQLAQKLRVPLATIRDWEHGASQADPALQALLRILDRIPEPALRALDDAANTA